MPYAFISGIPAAGKSYLARKVCQKFHIQHIQIDVWREEMRSEPELKKWVDFFWNQSEEEYWRKTSCLQQWKNLKMQSEVLWPTILKRIQEVQNSGKGAIFEGVNILPHLAQKDLNFSGIFFLGESYKTILERNKQNPRWGETLAMRIREAKAFYYCDRPNYKKEAEKFGFKTFSDSERAEEKLARILTNKK